MALSPPHPVIRHQINGVTPHTSFYWNSPIHSKIDCFHNDIIIIVDIKCGDALPVNVSLVYVGGPGRGPARSRAAAPPLSSLSATLNIVQPCYLDNCQPGPGTWMQSIMVSGVSRQRETRAWVQAAVQGLHWDHSTSRPAPEPASWSQSPPSSPLEDTSSSPLPVTMASTISIIISL